LQKDQLNKVAGALFTTLSSDDMFAYWSACCSGSEKVPKILRFIRHMTFDPGEPTAVVNYMTGHLTLGVGFFMRHITGPEDVLFILIHERDHLILRALYPEVRPLDYPPDLFNFGEDAFINANARRHLASTLPERFYKQPKELLLTGHHSLIDWDYFSYKENGFNMLKEVHAKLYAGNHDLLKTLGERIVSGPHGSGYQKWMRLIHLWYLRMQSRPRIDKAAGRNKQNPVVAENKPDDGLPESPQKQKEEKAEAKEDKGNETKDTAVNDAAGDKDEKPNTEDEEVNPSNNNAGGNESDDGDTSTGNGLNPEDDGIDSIITAVVPLVRQEYADPGDVNTRVLHSDPDVSSSKGGGLIKIALPRLKPNVVSQIIQSTCEDINIRKHVFIFEKDLLGPVDDLIHGILSDRALERSFDGYSVTVPVSLTRKDAFSVCCGMPPVVWQKRIGVEKPNLDLYVDVSGSMERYYGYIPYMYDALKHYVGRIFQFSTVIVEVNPDDLFLHTTGGTSFGCVAKHMIDNRVQAAVLLSDGAGQLSKPHIETLKHQLQFMAYIKVKNNDYNNWEQLAHETLYLQERRQQ